MMCTRARIKCNEVNCRLMVPRAPNSQQIFLSVSLFNHRKTHIEGRKERRKKIYETEREGADLCFGYEKKKKKTNQRIERESASYVYVGKAISSFAKRFYRLTEIRFFFLLLVVSPRPFCSTLLLFLLLQI